jgi:hypothetical protein
MQVANELFWSDNEFDIPTLDINKQSDCCEAPFIKWGVRSRKNNYQSGTIHFYTDDYKFSGLWRNPIKIIETNVTTVVETDYSSNNETPRAVFLKSLYKKRWLSRYWQKHGIFIMVNLNVTPRFATDNLIGVPHGWSAYCTRWYPDAPEYIDYQYRLAKEHAKSEDILFVVYGGGKSGKEYANEIKQPWIIDQAHEMRIKYYG